MVESSVSSIGRCHPERYRSTNLNWGICIQFDLLYPSWSADDSAILSSKREKTVNGFAWSPRLPPPCEGIQIRNPWNIFAFGIWNLGNFDRGIRVLGFEIRNPRHGIQNLEPSWIPLHGATRRCSHPRCHETGIYWWFYLFGPGSVTGNEDASPEDINKFRLEKAWGVFSVPQWVDQNPAV